MKHTTSSTSSEVHLYRKLVESPLYQTYRKAFTDATGLGVALLPADDDIEIPSSEKRYLNPFCAELNGRDQACRHCIQSHRCLAKKIIDRAETVTCFAGMRETAIPIRGSKETIALLTTGQVFTEEPDVAAFDRFAEKIDIPETDLDEFRQLWRSGHTLPLSKYQGALTVLAAFALQLSDLFNRLLIEGSFSEPDVVTRAKQFVNARLEDKVLLEEVSHYVGISSFYFCKVFKESTGMTLTEYVNRRRVEWAKRKLLDPRARVTEVAFDVGYQSLSQFNRSFLKYVGVSPTSYREKKKTEAECLQKLAA